MRTRSTFTVEKFVPEQCPNLKCKRSFRTPGQDYAPCFGEIVDGRRVRFRRDHYDLVVCMGCQNTTARVMVEKVTVFDETTALRLVKDGGFTCICSF